MQLVPRTHLSTRLAIGRRAPSGAELNSNLLWIAEASRLPRSWGQNQYTWGQRVEMALMGKYIHCV